VTAPDDYGIRRGKLLDCPATVEAGVAIDLEKEVRELKRRVDLAETRLAQLEGRFEFISGQLRDIQLYMHRKFDEIDAKLTRHDQRFDALEARFVRLEQRFDTLEGRFDALEGRFDTLEGKVDALPRALAEMLAERDRGT
jgi:chromosome segregation ATPase